MGKDLVRYKYGNRFEESYGYSQACRAGDTVYVSGQVSLDESGAIIGLDDFATQVKTVYAKIDKVLAQYGATRNDIVDETIFVVDPVKHYEAMEKLHSEYYSEAHPVSTYVGVTALSLPGMMIEIKVTAWLGKQ